MNGTHHRSMTRLLASAVLKDEELAGAIHDTADFPDNVGDIFVTGVGTNIAGHALCSLTHYCDEKQHGYSWKKDSSIWHPDLPNRLVVCYSHRWAGIFMPTSGHPLLLPEYRVAYADECEYPSSYAMAHWIEPFCRGGKKSSPRALGCALHFVQDACCIHHASGWLLKGHVSHEADLQERWFGGAFRPYRNRMIVGAVNQKRILSPSEAVRLAAASDKPSAGAIDSTIMRAVRYSAAVLRWWVA